MALDANNNYETQTKALALAVSQVLTKQLTTQISIAMDNVQALRNCLTCKHFVEHLEACTVSNNQRPPARIIAYGCPQFAPDAEFIPF